MFFVFVVEIMMRANIDSQNIGENRRESVVGALEKVLRLFGVQIYAFRRSAVHKQMRGRHQLHDLEL